MMNKEEAKLVCNALHLEPSRKNIKMIRNQWKKKEEKLYAEKNLDGSLKTETLTIETEYEKIPNESR